MFPTAALLVLSAAIIGFGTGQKSANALLKCKGATPTVANGLFQVNAGGNKATLQCKPGYDLVGEATVPCTAKLTWGTAGAQCQGLSGTEFATIFPRTAIGVAGNQRKILITTNGETTVNITDVSTATTQSILLDGFTEISFPTSLTQTDIDVINDKVVTVSADKPIGMVTFVSIIADKQAQESFDVRPIGALRKEYILITTEETPQFSVIALDDNTQVTMSLSNGVNFQRNLNRNQVYTRVFGTDGPDLTGSIITSDKNVAVVAGGHFAKVPKATGPYKDTFADQLIGVSDWKTLYIMAPFKPSTDGFLFKVVASEDNTEVSLSIDGTPSKEILNRGGKFTRLLPSNAQGMVVVKSNKPVSVGQFALTLPGPDTSGSMVMVVPPARYLSVYRFFATTPSVVSYVRIVIQDQFKGDLRLNGSPLSTFDELSVMVPGGDLYAILYIEVTPSVYYVLRTTNGERFGGDLYSGSGNSLTARSLGQSIV